METDSADPVTILEPDSPYFLTTLHVLGIAVATLFCCGLVYQIFYFKRTRYRPDESKSPLERLFILLKHMIKRGKRLKKIGTDMSNTISVLL